MNANELADWLDSIEDVKNWDELKKYYKKRFKNATTLLRQFDLAESIIKQQQLEIEALKDEVAKWKMSYENNIRFEDGYGHN